MSLQLRCIFNYFLFNCQASSNVPCQIMNECVMDFSKRSEDIAVGCYSVIVINCKDVSDRTLSNRVKKRMSKAGLAPIVVIDFLGTL